MRIDHEGNFPPAKRVFDIRPDRPHQARRQMSVHDHYAFAGVDCGDVGSYWAPRHQSTIADLFDLHRYRFRRIPLRKRRRGIERKRQAQ
jgi:hypothetical protein